MTRRHTTMLAAAALLSGAVAAGHALAGDEQPSNSDLEAPALADGRCGRLGPGELVAWRTVYAAFARPQVKRAVRSWNCVDGGVRLRMVSDPNKADIRVVAVRELPGEWFAATTTSCDSPCRPLRAVIRIERSSTGFALRHGAVSGVGYALGLRARAEHACIAMSRWVATEPGCIRRLEAMPLRRGDVQALYAIWGPGYSDRTQERTPR